MIIDIDKITEIDGVKVVDQYCRTNVCSGEDYDKGVFIKTCGHLKSQHKKEKVEDFYEERKVCKKCDCTYFNAGGVLLEDGSKVPLDTIKECKICKKIFISSVEKTFFCKDCAERGIINQKDMREKAIGLVSELDYLVEALIDLGYSCVENSDSSITVNAEDCLYYLKECLKIEQNEI